MVRASVCNEHIELLVLGRKVRGFLQSRQCFLWSCVSDIRLSEQILNVDAVVTAGTQLVQNINRGAELACRDIAECEVEVRCVFTGGSPARGQQVWNC